MSSTKNHLVFLLLIAAQYLDAQTMFITTDHGIPIQSPNRISYKTAYKFGPERHNYLCWTTTAESGGHFVALNLSTQKIFIHPLEHLEAYPIVFGTNGKVYVGSTSGYVMMWDPRDDSWKEAGNRLFHSPNSTVNHVRVLCEGADGWLYAGSCYGERARLNISTGAVEMLPSITEAGNWYISAATLLPDGSIAFGTGYKARIIIYNPSLGKDVGQWMPAEYQNDGFCFNVISGKNIVYATHFPSGHRLSFDASTGKYLGKIPWPDHRLDDLWSIWNHSSGYGSAVDFYVDHDNDVAFTHDGERIHFFHPTDTAALNVGTPDRLRPSPELDLALQYEVTTDCRVLQYDYKNKSIIERLSPNMPVVERNIFSLTTGPDRRVYGGAYQSTLLFRFDPNGSSLTVLGDHHPGWSGETFSYTNRGEELICASYTNGAVVAYNPNKGWNCEQHSMTNPKRIGFFGQNVYRPYETVVDGNGDLWGVGPAGWGTTGGGLATLSYKTGKVRSTNFSDIPHSMVFISTSTLVVCSDTLIRWWDTIGDSLLYAIPTPFFATSMCRFIKNTGDTVFYLSSNRSLVSVDVRVPGKVKVINEIPSPIQISRVITDAEALYCGGSEGIGLLDHRTLTVTILTDQPLHNRFAFTAADAVVYFSHNGHLLSLKIVPP